MKLFLIGPKFGVKNSNFPDYQRSAEYWRDLGHIVVSSAELDIEAGADRVYGWDPITLPPTLVEDYFRRDVKQLADCDAVVLLWGWDEDDQATLLAEIAEFCGMGAFEQTGDENFYHELGDNHYDDELEYEAPVEDDPIEAIFDELRVIRKKKRADYATEDDHLANYRRAENFGIPTWVGIALRLGEKMGRLENAAKNGPETINFDSTEDDFIDCMLISGLGLIAFREEYAK